MYSILLICVTLNLEDEISEGGKNVEIVTFTKGKMRICMGLMKGKNVNLLI